MFQIYLKAAIFLESKVADLEEEFSKYQEKVGQLVDLEKVDKKKGSWKGFGSLKRLKKAKKNSLTAEEVNTELMPDMFEAETTEQESEVIQDFKTPLNLAEADKLSKESEIKELESSMPVTKDDKTIEVTIDVQLESKVEEMAGESEMTKEEPKAKVDFISKESMEISLEFATDQSEDDDGEMTEAKLEKVKKKKGSWKGFGSLKRLKKAKKKVKPETKEANAESEQDDVSENGSAEPVVVQTKEPKNLLGEETVSEKIAEQDGEIEAKAEEFHEILNEIEQLVDDLGQVTYENNDNSENESSDLKPVEIELKEAKFEVEADILQDEIDIQVMTEQIEHALDNDKNGSKPTLGRSISFEIEMEETLEKQLSLMDLEDSSLFQDQEKLTFPPPKPIRRSLQRLISLVKMTDDSIEESENEIEDTGEKSDAKSVDTTLTENPDDLQVMVEQITQAMDKTDGNEKLRQSRPKLTRGLSFEIDVIEAEIDVKDDDNGKEKTMEPKRPSFKRMVSVVKTELNVPQNIDEALEKVSDKLGTLNDKIEALAQKLDQLPKPNDSEVPTREIQDVLRKEKAEIAAIMANAATNIGKFLKKTANEGIKGNY